MLASLADVAGVGERIVTTAPDVSISTNLGGWINKRGVYAHAERADHGGSARLLQWAPGPTGQHIELGISEMNLFMLLGQLGLSHEHHGRAPPPDRHRLRPVRAAWSRCVHLRRLQRRQVRRRRHTGGRDARTRGRCPSVDDHGVGRRGTPERHLLRARLCHRGRLAAVRRTRPALPARRHQRLSPLVDTTDRPGAVRIRPRVTGRGTTTRTRVARRLPDHRRRRRRAAGGDDRDHGRDGAGGHRRRGRPRPRGRAGERDPPHQPRPGLPQLAHRLHTIDGDCP